MSDEQKHKPDDADAVRYWWFDGDTVAALRNRLSGASDNAILKIVPKGRELFLEVIEPGQDAAARLAPLNESHVCPPFCIS